MLQSEYGKSALTKGHFNKYDAQDFLLRISSDASRHYFDEIKMAWVLADGTEGQSTFRD